jgi:hypothetical protein
LAKIKRAVPQKKSTAELCEVAFIGVRCGTLNL